MTILSIQKQNIISIYYNILGELVLTTKSKKTIDISKLSNGIFNIHVLTDQGTIVKKITTSK